MKINQLKNITEAPSNGVCLLYTRKEVIFKQYDSIDEISLWVCDSDILEIHLFDDNKEYRAISTKSGRFAEGFIEHVADFAAETSSAENVYRDELLLENDQRTIIVLNHINYDNNGLASIDDYRMMMGGNR